MIINQRRVRSLSKLSALEKGSKISIGVSTFDIEDAVKIGFSDELKPGECVLPSICGAATRLNAEGKYKVHKDQEKEVCYRMAEWTYKQWNGPNDHTEVTESVSVPYKRYPRTLIPPMSIEFTIIEVSGKKIIVSPEFIYGEDDEKLIMAINVVLERFGVCEVFSKNYQSFLPKKIIKLNWDVLPKGEYPWNVQKSRIEPFLSKAKGSNRKVVEKRHETINQYNPNFTAMGRGGFSGYLIHGFKNKDLYVLESVEVNNATYIVSGDWETISQLSKAEILSNGLHKYRIIHKQGWYEEIENILK